MKPPARQPVAAYQTAAFASSISGFVNTLDDRCSATTFHWPSIFADVDVHCDAEPERPARHRKEFILRRAVGDRDLAVAEESRRRADLRRGRVLVEDALFALDHAVVVRLDLGVPARDFAVEPRDGRVRRHLLDHAVDVLGVDAGLDLAEDLEELLAIVGVRIGVGRMGAPCDSSVRTKSRARRTRETDA